MKQKPYLMIFSIILIGLIMAYIYHNSNKTIEGFKRKKTFLEGVQEGVQEKHHPRFTVRLLSQPSPPRWRRGCRVR